MLLKTIFLKWSSYTFRVTNTHIHIPHKGVLQPRGEIQLCGRCGKFSTGPCIHLNTIGGEMSCSWQAFCQIKPISCLHNHFVKCALSRAMLSVHHRLEKEPPPPILCILSLFWICFQPQSGAFYGHSFSFLRCITPFLFTPEPLRDRNKNTSNQALKWLQGPQPCFLWMNQESKCVSVSLCVWKERWFSRVIT